MTSAGEVCAAVAWRTSRIAMTTLVAPIAHWMKKTVRFSSRA